MKITWGESLWDKKTITWKWKWKWKSISEIIGQLNDVSEYIVWKLYIILAAIRKQQEKVQSNMNINKKELYTLIIHWTKNLQQVPLVYN